MQSSMNSMNSEGTQAKIKSIGEQIKKEGIHIYRRQRQIA